VVEHPRNSAPTIINLKVLRGPMQVGSLDDLAGRTKERSSKTESTMLRCSKAGIPTPRERMEGGLRCMVGDAATEANGS
jgi:hypothetical protein